jgi:acyl carrier protein
MAGERQTTSGSAPDQAAALDRVVLDALATMSSTDEEIRPELTLEEIDVDSLDLVELAQIIEEDHGVDLPHGAFGEAVSVADVIAVVQSSL